MRFHFYFQNFVRFFNRLSGLIVLLVILTGISYWVLSITLFANVKLSGEDISSKMEGAVTIFNCYCRILTGVCILNASWNFQKMRRYGFLLSVFAATNIYLLGKSQLLERCLGLLLQ